jgi:hypothetical protein
VNVDELARSASQHVHTAARSMPVTQIDRVRLRRMVASGVPIVIAVVAAFVGLSGLLPETTTPPVASSPTTVPPSSQVTSVAVPGRFETIPIEPDDLVGLHDVGASMIMTLRSGETLGGIEGPLGPSPCCIQLVDQGVLLLDQANDRVVDIGGFNRGVAAAWVDLDAHDFAAGDGYVVVIGRWQEEVAILGFVDGEEWRLPLDIQADEVPSIAVADGTVWVGRRDLLPVDAGFAPIQWLPVASIDGTPVETVSRSEYRPFDGGKGVLVSPGEVSLVTGDGSGWRWELPDDLVIESAQPHGGDAVFITTTGNRSRLAYVLSPEGVMGIRLESLMPGGGHSTSVRGGGFASMRVGVAEVVIEATGTLGNIAPSTLGDTVWIQGSGDRILDSTGRLVREVDPISAEPGSVQSVFDSLYYLAADGAIHSVHPLGDEVVGGPARALIDFIVDPQLESPALLYIDADGEQAAETYCCDDGGGPVDVDALSPVAPERSVAIDQPDPDGPPVLAVEENGNEVLRVPVGTLQEPLLIVHSFDGRRLIVSREPADAPGPRTVFVIDLECVECTEVIRTTGPDSFDLVGVHESERSVVEPQLP